MSIKSACYKCIALFIHVAEPGQTVRSRIRLRLIVPLLLSAISAISAEEVWHRESFPAMGTMIEVALYGEVNKAKRAAAIAQEEFLRIERICNVFDADSELSRLNAVAATKPFTCSTQLWEIITAARLAWHGTDGYFDISVKPLMELWGLHRKQRQLPQPADITVALARVGLTRVIFDDATRSVKFTTPAMALDFGGVAKGFALSRAGDAVAAVGIDTGIINAGGNVYCLKHPRPGVDIAVVGIRDPLEPERLCGKLRVSGGYAVSTSGGYERFVEIGGRKYSHIINPHTGKPAEEFLAVTVIATDATVADCLSTAIFAGGNNALRIITCNYPQISGVVFHRDATGNLQISCFGKIDFSKD